jgi:hypothetical protein
MHSPLAAFGLLLALTLPLAGHAAEKDAARSSNTVLTTRSNISQAAKPNADQLAVINNARAAMMPALQQMNPLEHSEMSPMRTIAQRSRLDSSAFAGMDPSRSILSLPQAMKAEPAATGALRSIALAQMQIDADSNMSPARTVIVNAILLSKDNSAMSPAQMPAEKFARMQRAARSPLAKWQVKYRMK